VKESTITHFTILKTLAKINEEKTEDFRYNLRVITLLRTLGNLRNVDEENIKKR
jgi:hypothetical protein